MRTSSMDNKKRFTEFIENFSESRMDEIDTLYAAKLDFCDPLNSATERDHFKRIELDLFKQLKEIKFKVLTVEGDDQELLAKWEMTYKFRIWNRSITGVSHVKFDQNNQIHYQHDFWDASLSIYGEFPPLGWVMKGIKKVLSVK